MGKKHIKHIKLKKKSKSKGKIKPQEPKDYNKEPILFSFERVQDSSRYGFSKLSKEHKSKLIESIFKRRNKTWNDLNKSGRHDLGFEKINIEALRLERPKFLTEDTTLLVFRYTGNNHAMVGYRIRNIFYILWFDHDYTLYKHS